MVEESNTGAERIRRWLTTVAEAAIHNPVLVRDLRTLPRGQQQARILLVWILTFVLSLLGGLVSFGTNLSPASPTGYDRGLFAVLSGFGALILVVLVVGWTAGSVRLEVQKRTYDAVAVTSLTAGEYVYGKVAGVTVLGCLWLVCTVPGAALFWLAGGVALTEVLAAYAWLVLCIPLWAGIGVYVSATAQGMTQAVVAALIFIGVQNGVLKVMATVGTLGSLIPFVPRTSIFGLSAPTLLGFEVSPWLLGLPFMLLLIVMMITAAADSLPVYRPRRSARLRWMLLVTTSVVAFVAIAGSHGSPMPFGGTTNHVALGVLWLWGCVLVIAFASYPVPEGERSNSLRRLWSGWRRGRWLQRESRGGPWAALVFWLAGATAIEVATAAQHLVSPGRGQLLEGPLLVTLAPLLLYPVSLFSYGVLGFLLSNVLRNRQTGTTVMFLLLLGLGIVPFLAMAADQDLLVVLSPFWAHGAVSEGSQHGPAAMLLAMSLLWQAAIGGVACLGLWLVGRRAAKRMQREAEQSLGGSE